MRLCHLWLADFRNYTTAEVDPAPDGLTVVVGANGQGKTNLLEAVGWLATLESFRGAPDAALVRDGALQGTAVIRAEGDREGRALLIEAEVAASGRNRIQVNRQPLRRTRDLLGSLRVSVFAPDDLALVKGGPAERRRYLDDLLVSLTIANDALHSDLERVLRQRAALLKQAGGRLSAEIAGTLDVWDERLALVGTAWVEAREDLVRRLTPELSNAYDHLAGVAVGAANSTISVSYVRSWTGRLVDALGAARVDDVRRGVSTVGPHRDDLALCVRAMAARTHASQGEQRSLALALRLAAHRVVTDVADSPPILLLDDVFSELDPDRSAALVAHLPAGQTLLTTAGDVPAGMHPDAIVKVHAGTVVPARGGGVPGGATGLVQPGGLTSDGPFPAEGRVPA